MIGFRTYDEVRLRETTEHGVRVHITECIACGGQVADTLEIPEALPMVLAEQARAFGRHLERGDCERWAAANRAGGVA